MDYIIPEDSPIDRFIESLRGELGDDEGILALCRATLAFMKKRHTVDDVRTALGMLLNLPASKIKQGFGGIEEAWGYGEDPWDYDFKDRIIALRGLMLAIGEARVRWREWLEDSGI